MVVEKKTITSNYFEELIHKYFLWNIRELYDSVNNFTDRLDVSKDTILQLKDNEDEQEHSENNKDTKQTE